MKKNARVIFRVSTKQEEGLHLLAHLEDKTVSQYLRSLIDKELIINSLTKNQKQGGSDIIGLNNRITEAIKKLKRERRKVERVLRN